MAQEDSGFEVEGEEGSVFLLQFHRDGCFLVLLRLGFIYDMCSKMFNLVAKALVVILLLPFRMHISTMVDREYLLEGVYFLARLGGENEGFQKST